MDLAESYSLGLVLFFFNNGYQLGCSTFKASLVSSLFKMLLTSPERSLASHNSKRLFLLYVTFRYQTRR